MVRRWRLIGYFPILYNPGLELTQATDAANAADGGKVSPKEAAKEAAKKAGKEGKVAPKLGKDGKPEGGAKAKQAAAEADKDRAVDVSRLNVLVGKVRARAPPAAHRVDRTTRTLSRRSCSPRFGLQTGWRDCAGVSSCPTRIPVGPIRSR
jgi:hypothetical protein